MLRLSVWLLLIFIAPLTTAQIVISGAVEAENSQIFVAPVADSWQVQIDWMVEEGQKVKPGDVVVLYNTANLASTIEQMEANLRKVTAEAERSALAQALELREAQFRYDSSLLELEKARLDAGIAVSHISEFEYANNQLALEKAIQERDEANKALAIKKENVAAEAERNQLEIAGAENALKRNQLILSNMTQRAAKAGTAKYVKHPWNEQMIRAGDTVQRGFSVLEIPSTDKLLIRAWLNEVDIARVSEGDSVRIGFDAVPAVEIAGHIERVGNQAQVRPNWGAAAYIPVTIAFDPKAAPPLIPGMSVRVVVEHDASVETDLGHGSGQEGGGKVNEAGAVAKLNQHGESDR